MSYWLIQEYIYIGQVNVNISVKIINISLIISNEPLIVDIKSLFKKIALI